VQITWRGHSCFTFEDSVSRQFLVDPFDDTIGYKMTWGSPDAVLITHEHFDHNHLDHTVSYELVRTTGVHTVAGVEVTSLLAFHDNEGGRRNGATRLFVWTMGGLRFAHLGDIGQESLSPEQSEALKNIDVLFIPVGGKTTVDGAQAAALVKKIQPRVAVPMHYGNKKVRFFEFDPVEPFLRYFDNALKLPDAGFQLRRATLPDSLTVYVPELPE
jgi:L-ascorbate metabolism protein UlaG (beta-lactamase superfamily)